MPRSISRACLTALILGFFTASAPSAIAQPAYRVKDINTSGNTSWPSGLTAAGNRLFFVADDGPHGRELWTSDGTGPGTTRIPRTSDAMQPMAAGSRMFFLRLPPLSPFELWVSDGTTGGTTFVKTLIGAPGEWAAVGSTFFFSLGSPLGTELWRSDGTGPGTVRVKESDPGDGPRNVQSIVAGNGRVYFFAAKGPVDTLWTSDGTPAGTFAVTAAPVPVCLVPPPRLAVLGNSVVFCGSDSTHGEEPWVSDGTDAGTILLKELAPGNLYSSSPQLFKRSGGRVYFTANAFDLWGTDGTPTNTILVTSAPQQPPPNPITTFTDLTDVAGRLCFRSVGSYSVWTTDGTGAGTMPLFSGKAQSLTAVGSRLFFGGESTLWVSDLTPGGTRLLRSFVSQPSSLAELNGWLYFFADDGLHGPQLWKSDGTEVGTTLVRVIHPGFASSNPGSFCEAAGTLFFGASSYNPGNGLTRSGLWKTDGTEAGTVRVSDFSGESWVSLGPRLAFPGPGSGPLWETDGTPGGAFRVPGQPDSLAVYNRQLVASGGRAFWFAGRASGNFELWTIDPAVPPAASRIGTFAQVSDLAATPEGVMFGAGADALFDLWKSDGTSAGTRLFRTFGSYQPIQIQRVGARWFLALAVPPTRFQVWVTDGTAAGTRILVDFNATPVGGVLFAGSLRGQALFRVFLPTGGVALWRSDGTAAGTFVLQTYPTSFAVVSNLTVTADGGFFSVSSDSIRFPQLWITDGSVGGTRLVRDFSELPGNPPPSVGAMFDVAGTLVFGLSTSTVKQLWQSDGSTAGTVLLQDLVAAEIQRGPIVAFGSDVFFAGSDPYAGSEVWAIPLAAAFTPRPTTFSLLNPCRVLDTRNATGFLGGPAVAARVPRVFPVGGACGIPSTARALAANVTVSDATSGGLLRIHASDIGAPDATVINFRSGQTRANNATIALGPDAEFTVRFEAPGGNVHVIVDIVGFFE